MELKDLIYFVVSILAVAVLSITIYVKRPKTYFKTVKGKGVANGIILAVGAVIVVAASFYLLRAEAAEFKYFDKGEVFMGLDHTKKLSPMCVSNQYSENGGNSDKLTSNLGVKAEIVSTVDDITSVTVKYTHHSCAFNEDNLSYDALGLEVRYRLW